jgi:hypothetical protein
MSVTPKFCASCGAPLQPGIRFCGKCGAPTEEQPAAGQPLYVAPPPPGQPPAGYGQGAPPYGGQAPGGWPGGYPPQPVAYPPQPVAAGGSGALYAIIGVVVVLAIAALGAGGWYFFLRPQAPTTSGGAPTALVAAASTPLVAAASTPTQAATSTIPPSPTTQPTVTPVPPTATPVPPSATPAPPTATRVPPTATKLPATATPVQPMATGPLPPGVQSGPLLQTLDFKTGPSGFKAEDTENVQWYHGDGAWRILLKKNSWSAWSTADTICSNCIAELTAESASGSTDVAYGMLIRYKDRDNYYAIRFSENGKYSMGKTVGGTWTDIVKWTTSPAIKSGKNQTNVLRVVSAGDNITIYANGQALTTVADDALVEGKVGMIASTYAEPDFEAAFRKLQIWQVK